MIHLTLLQKCKSVVQNRKCYSVAIYHISTTFQIRLVVCSIFPQPNLLITAYNYIIKPKTNLDASTTTRWKEETVKVHL
jgi:hypothetical protein